MCCATYLSIYLSMVSVMLRNAFISLVTYTRTCTTRNTTVYRCKFAAKCPQRSRFTEEPCPCTPKNLPRRMLQYITLHCRSLTNEGGSKSPHPTDLDGYLADAWGKLRKYNGIAILRVPRRLSWRFGLLTGYYFESQR